MSAYQHSAKRIATGLRSLPLVANGRLFMADAKGNVCALSWPDLSPLWNQSTGTAPKLISDLQLRFEGPFLITSTGRRVLRLSPETGAIESEWTLPDPVDIKTAALFGEHSHMIAVPAMDEQWQPVLRGFDLTSSALVWTTILPSTPLHTVSAEARVVVTCPSSLVCLSMSGEIVWTWQAPSPVTSHPLRRADKIVVGLEDGTLIEHSSSDGKVLATSSPGVSDLSRLLLTESGFAVIDYQHLATERGSHSVSHATRKFVPCHLTDAAHVDGVLWVGEINTGAILAFDADTGGLVWQDAGKGPMMMNRHPLPTMEALLLLNRKGELYRYAAEPA